MPDAINSLLTTAAYYVHRTCMLNKHLHLPSLDDWNSRFFPQFFVSFLACSQVKGLHCPWTMKNSLVAQLVIFGGPIVRTGARNGMFVIIFITDWPPSIWRQFSVDNTGTNKESWLIRSDFKDRWQSSRLKIGVGTPAPLPAGSVPTLTMEIPLQAGPRAHLEINARELIPNNSNKRWTRFITVHKIFIVLPGKRHGWMKNKWEYFAGGCRYCFSFVYFWRRNQVKIRGGCAEHVQRKLTLQRFFFSSRMRLFKYVTADVITTFITINVCAFFWINIIHENHAWMTHFSY